MSYLAAYAAALVVFLVVDAVWIRQVMRPLFERNLGDMLSEKTRLGVAAGFYALYVAAVVWLAVVPAASGGGWQTAALNGAILGFAAYGTYEATNMATLKRWTWGMVATDTAWGMFLTALSALTGYAAHAFVTG